MSGRFLPNFPVQSAVFFPCLAGVLALSAILAAPTDAETGMSAAARTFKPPVINQWGETVGQRTVRLAERVDLVLPYTWDPAPPEERVCQGPDFQAFFFAPAFAQGNAAYVEILPPEPPPPQPGTGEQRKLENKSTGPRKATNDSASAIRSERSADPVVPSVQMYFDSRPVPLERRSWGLRGFFAIGPNMQPGDRTVLFVSGTGQSARRWSCPFPVETTHFPVEESELMLGRYSDQQQAANPRVAELIQRSLRRKNEIFARISPNMIRASMAHPRDMHKITSAYHTRRVTNRYTWRNGQKVYLAPLVNIHRGVDLKGMTGAPIFALLDGVVAAAEPMYWEGNHTILDHGEGIFTVYMHQSRMLVREGARVRAGDLIGLTGATGAVTGPHLHIALYIRGVAVDPLSMLSLPVRD